MTPSVSLLEWILCYFGDLRVERKCGMEEFTYYVTCAKARGQMVSMVARGAMRCMLNLGLEAWESRSRFEF